MTFSAHMAPASDWPKVPVGTGQASASAKVLVQERNAVLVFSTVFSDDLGVEEELSPHAAALAYEETMPPRIKTVPIEGEANPSQILAAERNLPNVETGSSDAVPQGELTKPESTRNPAFVQPYLQQDPPTEDRAEQEMVRDNRDQETVVSAETLPPYSINEERFRGDSGASLAASHGIADPWKIRQDQPPMFTRRDNETNIPTSRKLVQTDGNLPEDGDLIGKLPPKSLVRHSASDALLELGTELGESNEWAPDSLIEDQDDTNFTKRSLYTLPVITPITSDGPRIENIPLNQANQLALHEVLGQGKPKRIVSSQVIDTAPGKALTQNDIPNLIEASRQSPHLLANAVMISDPDFAIMRSENPLVAVAPQMGGTWHTHEGNSAFMLLEPHIAKRLSQAAIIDQDIVAAIQGSPVSLQLSSQATPPEMGRLAQVPVATQLLDGALRALSQPMDMQLDPQELGCVRISMNVADGAIAMTILAERQETLDLARRHADQLAQDLRELGYEKVSFTFGQQSRSQTGAGDLIESLNTRRDRDDPQLWLSSSEPGPYPQEAVLDIRV